MTIVFILAYYRRIAGFEYHEIISITFPIFVITHILVNYKWGISTIKTTFTKGTNTAIKITGIINILLFISVFLCIYSGILNSRNILTFISSSNMIWRSIHGFTAKASFYLIILHILLHINPIRKLLFKITKKAKV